MTTVYHSIRTRSPGYTSRSPLSASSNQNLAQFDSKLDNLLEDLQNTVSKRSNSLTRVPSVKSFRSKPSSDYCSDDAYSYTSPDGAKHMSSYRKETFRSNHQDGTREKTSLNELDSLLDDLQHTKDSTAFSDKAACSSSLGPSPDFRRLDDQTRYASSSKRALHKEIHYGDTPRASSCSRLERSGHHLEAATTNRDVHYSSATTTEGTYGDLRPLRGSSPCSSRASTLNKQTKITHLQCQPVELIETVAPNINPEVLAHLDPSLHPPNNTKVTTTIKTYTYEIPGDSGDYTQSQHLLDTSLDSNQSSSACYVQSAQTTPSKSFVYAKNDTSTAASAKMDSYRRCEASSSSGYNESKRYLTTTTTPTAKRPNGILKETVTTRNYPPSEPTNHTYIYNETLTSRNLDEGGCGRRVTTSTPTREQTYMVEEINDATYPPPRPKSPISIQFNYKAALATTNTYTTVPNGGDVKARAEETTTTTTVFPPARSTADTPDGPPKKLDELMASIGSEPPNNRYNAGYTQREYELQQHKRGKVCQDEVIQRKETVTKSKNVAGPPVYYPPGELFAKKEEAAWKAEGGYERESGDYLYESERKEKSKAKRKATVVPICLPLCCGLPCTIM